MADLSARAVIAGRYRVEHRVGAGGMGEVWAGEQIGIGARVAIKTLLPAAAMNHEVIARFKREALLLGRIRSDQVARVVDFVEDGVYGLVLVMEFVEGESLSRILQEGPMSIEDTIDLGVDIASALKDLHQVNIIHRDLKPGNIIMRPLPDGRRRAVVVDFGVSRIMSAKDADEDEELTGITRADMAVGTIEYMAPEQILNSRNVTPASDVYAAGAILFRAVAGRHIFGSLGSDAELAQKKLTTESSSLPLQRDDKVAEGFAKVVAKMLKRRPSERYKNADDVLADLVPVRDMARAAWLDPDGPTLDVSRGLPPGFLPQPAPAPPVPVSQPLLPAAASAPGTSVAAPQPLTQEAASKRGIPTVVTLGLVAAALVGGVFLGAPLLRPSLEQPAIDTSSASSAVSQAPPVMTAAPVASATAEPAATASADVPVDAGAAPTPLPPNRLPGPMPKPKAASHSSAPASPTTP